MITSIHVMVTPPSVTPAASTRVKHCADRIVYTFPLVSLPGETRRAAFVLVWHSDGRMETHFIPNIEILQEYGVNG